MRNLHQIGTEVVAVANKLWPNLSLTTTIRPLADLTLGDISSNICFSIAAQSGRAVAVVTEELAAALNRESKLTWQALFGYVNGTFSEPIVLDAVEPLAPLPSRAIIGVPAPRTESEVWAFARLASVAAMQRQLLTKAGVATDFLIGNRLIALNSPTWSRDILLAVSDSVGAECAADLLLKSDVEAVFLWLRTQSVPSSVFQQVLADPRAIIRELTPEQALDPEVDLGLKEWLELFGHRAFGHRAFGHHAGQLVVYLAQGGSGLDLFPELSMGNTTDNLCWLLDSLRPRLNASDYSVSRCLMHRLRYLPVFERRAAIFGEVFDFMTAARDTITELRNSCNGASPNSGYKLSAVQAQAALDTLNFLQFP